MARNKSKRKINDKITSKAMSPFVPPSITDFVPKITAKDVMRKIPAKIIKTIPLVLANSGPTDDRRRQ